MLKYSEILKLIDDLRESRIQNVPKIPKHKKYMEIIDKYILEEYISSNQFIYQKELFVRSQEMTNILENIIKKNIEHIKVLNEITIKLGGTDKLINEYAEKVHEENLVYQNHDLREIIKYNIEFETNRIQKYEELIELTNNDILIEIYKTIKSDKYKIIEILNGVV